MAANPLNPGCAWIGGAHRRRVRRCTARKQQRRPDSSRYGARLLVVSRSGRPQHLPNLPAPCRSAEGLPRRAAPGFSRQDARRPTRSDLYVGHGRTIKRSKHRCHCHLLCFPSPGRRKPSASPETAGGEKIFTQGIPSESVPGCMSCHGEKAEGNGPIPRLAGQHQAYLARQLEAFASMARANEIMHENSKDLTAEQISEVTAYLATL